MSTKYIQVFTTVDDREKAEWLARQMVESRLAGCVQILGPMQSVYRWKGRVETAREYLLLIKTRGDLYPRLERWLKTHHPYEVPEILAVPVEAGLPAYLQWLERVLETPAKMI